jgi:tetratricopeptide (TPR) repeat protein
MVAALYPVRGLLAELDLLRGEPEVARSRLEVMRRIPGREAHDALYLAPTLAQAYLRMGELERAGSLLADALEQIRALGHRIALVEVLIVQAAVLIRRQRWDDAEDSIVEGLELARGMPYPFAEARLLEEHGALLAATGRFSGPARKQAAAIYNRLGARIDSERIRSSVR